MASAFPRHNLSIKKVLDKWDQAYRYEVLQEGVKMQLYSIFLNDKDSLSIVHRIASNLVELKGEIYTQIHGITIYNKDSVFEKYNLQILADFARNSLVRYSKRLTDRGLKLSAREFALLLKNFVAVLHDMVLLQENYELFQYIRKVWDNNLFGAFYLSDNFEVKINLLPEMDKIPTFDWSTLLQPFDGTIGSVFEKVIDNFIQQICLLLPLKKDKQEILQSLPALSEQSNKYWDQLFVLPERVMATIFELVTINQGNYEEKIKQLHAVLSNPEGFIHEIVAMPPLKYDYEKEHPKSSVRITNEYSFYRFLYNLNLDYVVNLYYPGEFANVKKIEVKTNQIEKLIIQMVDISTIILFDLANISFPALKHLTLQACGITAESLKVIFSWSAMNTIELLDFSGSEQHNNLITSKGCLVIAECDKLKNLKELNLACCKIDDLALSYLCSSPHLENLEKIDLGFNRHITKEGIKYINESARLKKLNNLIFLCDQLGDENIVELLKPSPYPKKYKSLNFCECNLTLEGLNAICQSESTETLEDLYLDANSFQNLAEWKAPKVLPALKKLSAQFCGLADENIPSLFSMLNLENLNYLDVSFNEQVALKIEEVKRMVNLKELLVESTSVSHQMLEILTQENTIHHLEKLSFRRGVDYSSIFEKISKAKTFPDLRSVSLNRVSNFQYNLFFLLYPYMETSHNLELLNFHSGLLDALLLRSTFVGSLYFNNLAELKLLNLASNGNNMLNILAKSDKVENLKILDMSSSAVGDKGMKLLGKQERLKSLKKVVFIFNRISTKAIKQFLSSKACGKLRILDLSGGPLKSKDQTRKIRVYKEKYQPELVFDV